MGNQKTLTPEPEDKDVGVTPPGRKINRRLESYKKSFRDLGARGRREVFPFGQAGGDADEAQGEARGEGERLRGEHNSYSGSLGVGGSGLEKNLIGLKGKGLQGTDVAGTIDASYGKMHLHNPNLVARTISQRYYKDGSENLILKRHRKGEVRNHGQIVPTLTESHEHHGGANPPLVARTVGTQTGRNSGTDNYVTQRKEGGGELAGALVSNYWKGPDTYGNRTMIRVEQHEDGSENLIQVGEVREIAHKRKHNTPKEINEFLRKNKGSLTLEEIAVQLNIPKTQVEHYFRTDESRATPSPDTWLKLKQLLKFSDEHDKAVTEIYEKEVEFESSRRVYSDGGISPTVDATSKGKLIAMSENLIRVGGLYDDGNKTHQAGSIYNPEGVSPSLETAQGGRRQPMIVQPTIARSMIKRLADVSGTSTCQKRKVSCIVVRDGKIVAESANHCSPPQGECQRLTVESGTSYELCNSVHAEASCVKMMVEKGERGEEAYLYGHTYVCDECVQQLKSIGVDKITIIEETPEIRPVLTPDREKKRQNGRRFKEDGEPMFTLTGQDVHGVAIKTVGNIYGKGENGQVYDPSGISRTLKSGETGNPKSGGIGSSNSPKILSHSPRTNDPKLGGSGPLVSGEHCFTVDSTPHQVINNMRIRRLTPVECEKLMNFPTNWTKYGYEKGKTLDYENVYGWVEEKDDEGDLEKVWKVVGKKMLEHPLEDTVLISDTQRYKLCGNSVVTSVITFIGRKLLEMMDE